MGTTFQKKILKGKSMNASLYKYGAIAAILIAIGFSGWSWHKTEVQKAVNAATTVLDTEYRVAIDEQRKRLVARSEASQGAMQKLLENSKRSKDAEVKKYKSDLADLRSSLQQRPERTTDSGSGGASSTSEGGSSQGATGMQLYRSHSEFLVEYAEMAAELQTELKSCISDYDSIREEIIKFKEGTLDGAKTNN